MQSAKHYNSDQKQSNFLERNSCPVCGSRSPKLVYKTSYNLLEPYLTRFYDGRVEFQFLRGSDFILHECDQCGLVYQRFAPNDVLVRKLYEEWIDPVKSKERQDFLQKTTNLKYAQEMLFIQEMIPKPPNKIKVLDFGMGWGGWCRMAQSFGFQVYGSELSEARIEHARRFGISITSWDDIPSMDFDFVNTEQVFEHLVDPLGTLKQLKSGLHTNGIIKISVPNGVSIKSRLADEDWSIPSGERKSRSNAVAPLEHINCFNYQALCRLAEKAGMSERRLSLRLLYRTQIGVRPFRMLATLRKHGTYCFFTPTGGRES